MALPTISIRQRNIVLLSGYASVRVAKAKERAEDVERADFVICDEAELRRLAAFEGDAVAFGYVDGHWVAAA